MKTICPKCKGSKRVIDWEDVVFSFGIDYFFQKAIPEQGQKTCPHCKGKGKVKP